MPNTPVSDCGRVLAAVGAFPLMGRYRYSGSVRQFVCDSVKRVRWGVETVGVRV